jgi:hypothetical protein
MVREFVKALAGKYSEFSESIPSIAANQNFMRDADIREYLREYYDKQKALRGIKGIGELTIQERSLLKEIEDFLTNN